MRYKDFLKKTEFSHAELLGVAWGTLVDDPPPELHRLPTPPFLMIQRVVEVQHHGTRGRIIGEQDIHLDDWFFQCHFSRDPVQPGCLGVDAIWQLLGLYGVLRGSVGGGRALGCREVEFLGQIRPYNKLVRYDIDVLRYSALKDRGVSFIVGTGRVLVDGEQIYTINDAKVGFFNGITYTDYPNRSVNAVGGVMKR